MYSLIIEKQALKYIKRLDRPSAKRIRDAIDQIAQDPYIGELLTNHTAQYKYRVGSYRILYDIYETQLVVCVIKIGPRGDVYN